MNWLRQTNILQRIFIAILLFSFFVFIGGLISYLVSANSIWNQNDQALAKQCINNHEAGVNGCVGLYGYLLAQDWGIGLMVFSGCIFVSVLASAFIGPLIKTLYYEYKLNKSVKEESNY